MVGVAIICLFRFGSVLQMLMSDLINWKIKYTASVKVQTLYNTISFKHVPHVVLWSCFISINGNCILESS